MTTYSALHLFGGIGGGALGFQRARAEWGGHSVRFVTLAGVDLDPAACRDFRRLTGAPAVEADLATMSPSELLAACGGETPDLVFMSPPCKGFSGLMGKEAASAEKYQAMNRLVLQALWSVLEAWPRHPRLLLIENVPRITSRGALLLAQVESLLAGAGYRWDRRTHDCGELGGLGQHRRRFLLLARHAGLAQAPVHLPPVRRLRTVGDVLGPLPMPDDPTGGPLHRLPRLQWKTWARLALIPAGGDWRDLPAGEYVPAGDPARFKGRPGLLGVVPWGEPSGAVTGSAAACGSNGVSAVADPRLGHSPRGGAYRVVRWSETAPTVTCAAGIGRSSAFAVADPRVPAPSDRPDPPPVIVAEDGTWHRPLTTWELAALQGLPLWLDGQPLTLDGNSDRAWRERIGNAVPPAAAEAIAEQALLALAQADAGLDFVLSATGRWARTGIERRAA